jgi:cell division control protein 6
MGLFDSRFSEEHSLFRDEHSLNYEFLPKELPFREDQQHALANVLAPLLHGRSGRNVLVHGAPGIGKTAAARAVLRELEEKHDEVQYAFVNCWQYPTTFRILVQLCDAFNYRLTHNKKTDELMDIIQHNLAKRPWVLVFDEIDKAEDVDFLYFLLERAPRASIILITNYFDWLADLDERIRSRLLPEILEFKPYTLPEVEAILRKRLPFAFQDDVWDDDAFALVAKTCSQTGDIRTGLYLLRESGNVAEEKFASRIALAHAERAVEKLSHFTVKKLTNLAEDDQKLFKAITAEFAEHGPAKIGELYKTLVEKGTTISYKTFQRKINHLSENRFLATERVTGGASGTTTLIKPVADRKLTEF